MPSTDRCGFDMLGGLASGISESADFMYAIISDSGRQFRVEEGQELEVDFRDVPQGGELVFDRVLAVSGDDGLKLGKPVVEGASVSAEVLGAELGKKIYVQKFRRRKNSRRRTGHRQVYTRVKINKIEAGGVRPSAATLKSRSAANRLARGLTKIQPGRCTGLIKRSVRLHVLHERRNLIERGGLVRNLTAGGAAPQDVHVRIRDQLEHGRCGRGHALQLP